MAVAADWREKDALGEPKQRKGPLGESEGKEKMRRAILKNIYPFFYTDP